MRLKKANIIIITVSILILTYLAGVVYADLTGTEGLAIDLSSAGAGTDFTIAFDPTELLGDRTWGDGSTDTIVWTWNRATGTDPTITFNSGSIGLPALTLVTPLSLNYGGLQDDVSAWTGLFGITGGAAYEIDTFAELDTEIADKNLVNKADGAVWLGVHDYGGATSIEIVNSTDPDVDAAGELSYDTDDNTLRGFDGANQIALAQKNKPQQFTIMEPDDLANDTFVTIWENDSGLSFIITELKSYSGTDDAAYTLVERDADGANPTTIEAVTISTDGTALYYNTVASGDIDHTTIEAGHIIGFDNSAHDDDYIKVRIQGYFDANVD